MSPSFSNFQFEDLIIVWATQPGFPSDVLTAICPSVLLLCIFNSIIYAAETSSVQDDRNNSCSVRGYAVNLWGVFNHMVIIIIYFLLPGLMWVPVFPITGFFNITIQSEWATVMGFDGHKLEDQTELFDCELNPGYTCMQWVSNHVLLMVGNIKIKKIFFLSNLSPSLNARTG